MYCNLFSNKFQFSDANGLTDTDIQVRHGIIEELRVILYSQYPKIKLEIFGSSANGFGMKDSDLDIYLQCTAVSTSVSTFTPTTVLKCYSLLCFCLDQIDPQPFTGYGKNNEKYPNNYRQCSFHSRS